jgi:hypothetical protein
MLCSARKSEYPVTVGYSPNLLRRVWMPASLPLVLLLAFASFFGFLHIHHNHAVNFKGSSQRAFNAINASAAFSKLTESRAPVRE